VAGLPTAATLVIYMIANFVLFGMPLPVSGAAKALWAPFFNADALWNSVVGSTPSAVGNLSEGAKSLPIGYAFMGAIALPLFVCRMPTGQQTVDLARRQLGTLLLVLLAANLFHLAYLTIGSSWPLWPWYAYLRAVLGILLLGFTLAVMPARLSPRLAVGLVSTALFLGGVASVIKHVNLGPNDNAYGVYVEEAAADLNRQLPPNSVVAMGDLAGGLGYRLDRPMVQLEGLMETPVYLQMLSEGRAHQYLREHGVTHVAAAGYKLRDCQDGPPGCHILTEPKFGRGPKIVIRVFDDDAVFQLKELSIWRYRPELQYVPIPGRTGNP
jgi:hypothetical protein